MRSSLARAIREARLAAGLTQEQLGSRLRLKGRAVYRWERDESVPRRRHRAALVTAIHQVNPAAGEALAVALANVSKRSLRLVQVPAPVVAPPAIDTKLSFELGLFAFAEELDVPARRARAAMARLHRRWREGGVTFETAERHLQASLEPLASAAK
jgi:transcriptional regulator with XRE-family HTH domain